MQCRCNVLWRPGFEPTRVATRQTRLRDRFGIGQTFQAITAGLDDPCQCSANHLMRPITSFPLRTVAIALTALACATSALGESGRSRLVEARVIVAVELAGEKTLAPCQIDAEAWMDYAVPADLARKYLGAHAGASPAPPPASPRATLDPRGARPEIFCSSEDNRARRDAAIAALKSGERTTQITLGYTFPVFDAAARTAIIIVEHDVTTWHRDDDGSRARPSGEMFGVAHVYKKRGKRWNRIATEEVYSGLY